MSDLPSSQLPILTTVHPWSMEAIGHYLVASGAGGAMASHSSKVWQSANRAYLFPFTTHRPELALQLWVSNGAAVSGNIDIGIYNSDGTRIVSTGSTAQAGISTIQAVTVSAWLPAGLLYLALVLDNTTGTTQTCTAAGTIDRFGIGHAEVASAFPLPATLTLAQAVNMTQTPFFGLSTNAVI